MTYAKAFATKDPREIEIIAQVLQDWRETLIVDQHDSGDDTDDDGRPVHTGSIEIIDNLLMLLNAE